MKDKSHPERWNPIKTIDEYHVMFPKHVRQLLDTMREAIQNIAPEAEEKISYNMPAFKMHNKPLAYYAAHKTHIGFYPTPSPIVAFKKELKDYSTSKGAIQFPIDKPMPVSLVKKLVTFRLTEISKMVKKK